MSIRKILLPAAALILVAAFLASHAGAQTMGEYATTTAATTSGPMGTDGGGSSRTWGVSALGSSWSERAGAASGSSMGSDFASRAGSTSSESAAESRWPDTGISSAASSLDMATDRFANAEDRFPSRDLSSGSRWPTSSISDNKGIDSSYNSVSGN